MTEYRIPKEIIDEVVSYLVNRPFIEVNPLIVKLVRVTKMQNDNAAITEGGKKNKG